MPSEYNFNGILTTKNIIITCFIYLGDTLSPLVFFITLIHLTSKPNRIGHGYKIGDKKVSSVFYMDVLIAKTIKSLKDYYIL